MAVDASGSGREQGVAAPHWGYPHGRQEADSGFRSCYADRGGTLWEVWRCFVSRLETAGEGRRLPGNWAAPFGEHALLRQGVLFDVQRSPRTVGIARPWGSAATVGSLKGALGDKAVAEGDHPMMGLG